MDEIRLQLIRRSSSQVDTFIWSQPYYDDGKKRMLEVQIGRQDLNLALQIVRNTYESFISVEESK